METVFQPSHTEDQMVLYVGIILAIAGAVGMVFLLRRKVKREEYNRNMLGAMLLFFLTTISAGTAFFSWWSMHKTGPVSIYTDAVETPYGKVAFNDIRKMEIIIDQPVTLIPSNNSRKSVKLLVIEEDSGKAHIMSEKNYDIQRIFSALKKAREK